MNCKQGDLAIVIRSVRGNEGKIVRCVSPLKIIEAWTVEPDFNPEVLGIPTFPDAWLQLIAAAKPKSVLIWLDNDLIGNPNEETRELLLARWIAKMRAKGVEPTPQMIEHQRTKAMGPKLVKALQALGVPTRAKEWASGTVPKMDMGQYLIEQGAF